MYYWGVYHNLHWLISICMELGCTSFHSIDILHLNGLGTCCSFMCLSPTSYQGCFAGPVAKFYVLSVGPPPNFSWMHHPFEMGIPIWDVKMTPKWLVNGMEMDGVLLSLPGILLAENKVAKNEIRKTETGWWFGTCILFFHSVGHNHHPNWQTHTFQRGRSTTNQDTNQERFHATRRCFAIWSTPFGQGRLWESLEVWGEVWELWELEGTSSTLTIWLFNNI